MRFSEEEKAYNEDVDGCRTEIDSRNMPWCIEFVDPFMSMDTKVIEGKLHIYFSCDDYYNSYYQGRNAALYRIGQNLKNLVAILIPKKTWGHERYRLPLGEVTGRSHLFLIVLTIS